MFNRNYVLLAAFAASLPFPGIAVAGDAADAARSIAEINERIAVMQAQLAELEMQAKISAKRAEIGKIGGANLVNTTTTLPTEEFIPSVREISGVDGRIWAVLNVSGGNTQTVRVGDMVGGWRVVEIRPDAVSVKRGADTLRLSFGVNPPQPAAPAAGGQRGGPLPPFPSN